MGVGRKVNMRDSKKRQMRAVNILQEYKFKDALWNIISL